MREFEPHVIKIIYRLVRPIIELHRIKIWAHLNQRGGHDTFRTKNDCSAIYIEDKRSNHTFLESSWRDLHSVESHLPLWSNILVVIQEKPKMPENGGTRNFFPHPKKKHFLDQRWSKQ